MDVSPEGKVALVTGCGPNIGSSIAHALARYRSEGRRQRRVERVDRRTCIARIERNGGTAMAAQGDVTDEETVKGYVNDVLAAWGQIDILINNAALLGLAAACSTETAEAFHRAVTVSSMSIFLNTKHVGRSMAERENPRIDRVHLLLQRLERQRGRLRVRVPQGRREQLRPGRGDGPRPLRHPSQQLHPHRAEPGQPGTPSPSGRRRAALPIRPAARASRAGAPAPPRAPTNGASRLRFDGPRNPMVPMGTTGTPTDIGHAVAWLCSDYARLITGIDLVVDGGARAKNFSPTFPASPADLGFKPAAADHAGQHSVARGLAAARRCRQAVTAAPGWPSPPLPLPPVIQNGCVLCPCPPRAAAPPTPTTSHFLLLLGGSTGQAVGQ